MIKQFKQKKTHGSRQTPSCVLPFHSPMMDPATHEVQSFKCLVLVCKASDRNKCETPTASASSAQFRLRHASVCIALGDARGDSWGPISACGNSLERRNTQLSLSQNVNWTAPHPKNEERPFSSGVVWRTFKPTQNGASKPTHSSNSARVFRPATPGILSLELEKARSPSPLRSQRGTPKLPCKLILLSPLKLKLTSSGLSKTHELDVCHLKGSSQKV